MKKRRVMVIAIVLIASAGALWWRASGDSAASGRLTLYGNVDIRTARLAFEGEGPVATMRVEEGARVQAGDLVATMDSTKIVAELAEAKARVAAQEAVVRRLESGTRTQEIGQARARVESAEARRANAERTLRRLEQSATGGAASQDELDDARAQFDIGRAGLHEAQQALALAIEGPRKEEIEEALAQLEAGRARVRLLEDRLADAELRSPATGTIQSRLLEVGEFATPNRPAYTLALTQPKWVRAYVPEPDLGRVRPGARAWVASDSFPSRTFDGWVGFISPVAEFTPKAVETTDLRTRLVYEVRVYVTDPEDRLRLGMPTTVTIDEVGQPVAASAPTSKPHSPATTTAGEGL